MYKLLIVDDEPIIADGLYERFADIRMPQVDIYKAYSGTEALRWLNRKKMDVVITDICMPGMDGLTLLKRIRSNWPKCRVIFLTGHDRFDYIYQATCLGGVSYLLKSDGYDEIIALTERYLNEIRQSSRDEELLRQAQEQWQRSLPLLQREFLCDLADGDASPVDQRQLDECGIPLLAEAPVLLLTGCLGGNQEQGRRARADFCNIHPIIESHLSCCAALIGAPHRGHMLWLLQLEPDEAREWDEAAYLKGLLESVQAVCAETFGLKVSFALSCHVAGWDAVGEHFSGHRALLAGAMRTGQEIVLVYKGASEGEEAGFARAADALKRKLRKVQMLEMYLEQGRQEDFFTALGDIEALLPGQSSADTLYHEAFYSLSVMFLSYFNQHAAEHADTQRLTQIGVFTSPRAAFEYFAQLADGIFSQQNAELDNRAALAVQRVQRYIQDNPGGDLSLSSLADLVYFNPKYLSRLFKQVSGTNLSDYIQNVRLMKVKELLRESGLKVHEIAEAIGYFSAPCFTRFFKRAMGMTPQEYRDMRLQGE